MMTTPKGVESTEGDSGSGSPSDLRQQQPAYFVYVFLYPPHSLRGNHAGSYIGVFRPNKVHGSKIEADRTVEGETRPGGAP
jgi:hypothetical protein